MASPAHPAGSSAPAGPHPVPSERDGWRRPPVDLDWRPGSTDLAVELRALVGVLDEIRGPVNRLLLGVGGWASRPHEVVTNGRTVTVGYLAAQPSWMVTVLCADGGTFTMRVTPPGAAPSVPYVPESGPGDYTRPGPVVAAAPSRRPAEGRVEHRMVAVAGVE